MVGDLIKSISYPCDHFKASCFAWAATVYVLDVAKDQTIAPAAPSSLVLHLLVLASKGKVGSDDSQKYKPNI